MILMDGVILRSFVLFSQEGAGTHFGALGTRVEGHQFWG